MRIRDAFAGLATIAGLVLPASALPATALAASPGEQVFMDNCAACHQPTGIGVKGAFPPLKGNKFVVGPKTLVAATVLNGRGGMPAWKSELNDAQIASVVTYVRTSWGNKAPPLTPGEVAAVRANTKAAPVPKAGLQAH